MQGLHGVSRYTADRLVLDAGKVYLNIDEDKLLGDDPDPVTQALSGAIPLGATRDGSTFNRNPTIREIEVDGAMGPVKGLRRRESVAPTLTVSFVELTKENLLKAFAGAVSTSGSNYDRITGGEITEESYVDNVALLATYSGSTDPVIVVVRNALVTEGWDMAFEDRNEVAVEVEFAGHFDADDLDKEPWAIYHPGEGSGGGDSGNGGVE